MTKHKSDCTQKSIRESSVSKKTTISSGSGISENSSEIARIIEEVRRESASSFPAVRPLKNNVVLSPERVEGISPARAREIMGSHFFGFEENEQIFGTTLRGEVLQKMQSVPYTEEELQATVAAWCQRKDERVPTLVAIVPTAFVTLASYAQLKDIDVMSMDDTTGLLGNLRSGTGWFLLNGLPSFALRERIGSLGLLQAAIGLSIAGGAWELGGLSARSNMMINGLDHHVKTSINRQRKSAMVFCGENLRNFNSQN